MSKLKQHVASVLLGLAAAGSACRADASTYTFDYSGYQYTLQNVYSPTDASLRAQPWYGDRTLAEALSGQVLMNLGGYANATPQALMFAYGQSFAPFYDTAYYDSSSNKVYDCTMCLTANGYNFAELVSKQKLVYYTLADAYNSINAVNKGVQSNFVNTNLVVNGSHSHPMSHYVAKGKKTFWMAGDLGSDNHGERDGSSSMGEVGGGYNFGPVQLNLSLGKTWAHQNFINNGSLEAQGKYVMLEGIVPVNEAKGLYATLGAYRHWNELDITRGYSNMGVIESSSASNVGAKSWGVRARMDWENALLVKTVSLSPYVDLWHSQGSVSSYTETGGSYPAHYNGLLDSVTEARLGVNGRLPIKQTGFDLVADLEAAHRFNRHAAAAAGNVDNMFTFDVAGERYHQNWLRGGIGVEGKVGKGKAFVMLNATTKSNMPSSWLAASYQLTF